MAYSVKCYFYTGFNAVNIPDSPDLLSKFRNTTLPAIDLLQPAGLSQVYVKTTWETISGVDYCQIGDEYYSVGTPQMVAEDVALLSLVPDMLTTLGGPGKLVYLDGITERHTTASDNLFEYTQEDEYMTPQQPLVLEVSNNMLFAGNTSSHTAVESTIDLVKLGSQFDEEGNFNGTGITFEDTSTAHSGESVTVPYTEGVGARTNYQLGSQASNSVLSPNTRLYEASEDHPLVMRALAAVRSLGIESALISQVAYPDEFVQSVIGSDGQYSSTVGKDLTESTGLKFNYNETVKNKRLLCGQYCKYGLLSASGASGEYLPEQISEDDSAPSVRCLSDPRPDGKPYFRFTNYEGNSNTDTGFFISCISGMQWQNVPLTYTAPSGSYMNEINFRNDAKIAGNQQVYNQRQAVVDTIQGAVSGGLNAAASIAGIAGIGTVANPGSAVAAGIGAANTIFNTAVDTGQSIAAIVHSKTQYEMARNKELQNFQISQNVVAPDVLFPFNANIIRDFIGNGVIAYRYHYSGADATRIDKILTMYGYKDSVALTPDLFSNRTNFDYVRAFGVSIGTTTVAMWRKEVATEQLNAGVRVWHVAPNPSYYSDNPTKG